MPIRPPVAADEDMRPEEEGRIAFVPGGAGCGSGIVHGNLQLDDLGPRM